MASEVLTAPAIEAATAAVVEAARAVEAAITAWANTDVSDPAKAEKAAVLEAGFALYDAIAKLDRLSSTTN